MVFFLQGEGMEIMSNYAKTGDIVHLMKSFWKVIDHTESVLYLENVFTNERQTINTIGNRVESITHFEIMRLLAIEIENIERMATPWIGGEKFKAAKYLLDMLGQSRPNYACT